MNIWEDNMKKTIKDYNLKNKKVIIRCDLNVPIKNGERYTLIIWFRLTKKSLV